MATHTWNAAGFCMEFDLVRLPFGNPSSLFAFQIQP
uniref:Uncharacterized protein n=1 Tax=Anguilla anguilla TaxID=7936 RepID=A0A0E9UG21_ANGAN